MGAQAISTFHLLSALSATKSTKSDGRTHLAPPQHHIGPRTRQGLVKDIFFAKIENVDKFKSINMWPKIDVN